MEESHQVPPRCNELWWGSAIRLAAIGCRLPAGPVCVHLRPRPDVSAIWVREHGFRDSLQVTVFFTAGHIGEPDAMRLPREQHIASAAVPRHPQLVHASEYIGPVDKCGGDLQARTEGALQGRQVRSPGRKIGNGRAERDVSAEWSLRLRKTGLLWCVAGSWTATAAV